MPCQSLVFVLILLISLAQGREKRGPRVVAGQPVSRLPAELSKARTKRFIWVALMIPVVGVLWYVLYLLAKGNDVLLCAGMFLLFGLGTPGAWIIMRAGPRAKLVPVEPDEVILAEQYRSEAWAEYAQGHLMPAYRLFTRAIALNPNDAYAYFGRAMVGNRAGWTKEPLADFTTAIALHPGLPMAYAERGHVRARSDDTEAAMADFRKAIAVDPACGAAHWYLGTVYERQKKWRKALACYEWALRLDPDRPGNHWSHGHACTHVGDYQRAVEDFQAYLRTCPSGEGAQGAEEQLQWLRERGGDIQPRKWSVRRQMWTEFVSLSLQDTVAEVLRAVRRARAFYVLFPLPEGERAVVPVYRRHGLRSRLTEIADTIGPDILRLRLGQLLDQWHPGVSIDPSFSRERAVAACEEDEGHAVVVEDGRVVGVLNVVHDYAYPWLPTILFAARPAFRRKKRRGIAGGARRCGACGREFAYYRPVLRDDALVDYACPRCGASPIVEWVEERMRPEGWSQAGFLGTEERLDQVIGQDAATLERLGITYEQIADRLNHLLDVASADVEDQVAEWIERTVVDQSGSPDEPDAGPALAEPFGPLDELEHRYRQGELEGSGCYVNGLWVYLEVHIGYQRCPWTALYRPWSGRAPDTPVRTVETEEGPQTVPVAGASLPCRSGTGYRYGDRNFLIVNEATGEYLCGPGLIVHLVRDHHFFEGKASPYRVDPEKVARVLGLLLPTYRRN